MASQQPADVVVAADGSGNYSTVAAAIAAAPSNSDKRHVIHVKRGVYREFVALGQDKRNIVLFGDGIDATVITGSRCCADGFDTPETAILRDVVVHIFLPQQRAFYNLEEFYGNATPIELPFDTQCE